MVASVVASLSFFLLMFSRYRSAASSRVPLIFDPENEYVMPSEEHPHEGTWLQWPHDYGWDPRHVERYEGMWISFAEALHTGERVHIVVFNDFEKQRVQSVLQGRALNMSQIDFYVWPTDDVWVRDNGPIFVKDQKDGLIRITNWKFNGWGKKVPTYFDDYIPLEVGCAIGIPVTTVPMVIEGGAVELDGRGTLMAKRSSILNTNRNPSWTQNDAESYFRRYLGVTNFIWLNGVKGGDITDDHIDGTARFANGDTIITPARSDFVVRSEYDVLKNARDVNGNPYKIVHIPITSKKIPAVGDYGIYVNYYVGNEVVIVPAYGDVNDAAAASVLQQVYPTRRLVSIDMTELYKDGGLVHCVTQQQPN